MPADYWDITHAILRLFDEAGDLPPFLKCLQVIGSKLEYEVTAFWLVNDSHMVLDCVEYFSLVPNAFPQFETVTRARHFSAGEGLPGTVWSKCEVTHIPDLSQSTNFPRFSVAKQEGLKSGLGFPLHVGRTVLGAIELLSRDARPASPEMKRFLFAIGGQIGVFLERLAMGRDLHSADAQFQLLAQAASMAVFTIDEHSNVLFASAGAERIFGYRSEELIGRKLMMIMPEYLRGVHEAALRKYVATGERHLNWDGVSLVGLHKSGKEISVTIAFSEFTRKNERVFTGFVQLRQPTQATTR